MHCGCAAGVPYAQQFLGHETIDGRAREVLAWLVDVAQVEAQRLEWLSESGRRGSSRLHLGTATLCPPLVRVRLDCQEWQCVRRRTATQQQQNMRHNDCADAERAHGMERVASDVLCGRSSAGLERTQQRKGRRKWRAAAPWRHVPQVLAKHGPDALGDALALGRSLGHDAEWDEMQPRAGFGRCAGVIAFWRGMAWRRV